MLPTSNQPSNTEAFADDIQLAVTTAAAFELMCKRAVRLPVAALVSNSPLAAGNTCSKLFLKAVSFGAGPVPLNVNVASTNDR